MNHKLMILLEEKVVLYLQVNKKKKKDKNGKRLQTKK